MIQYAMLNGVSFRKKHYHRTYVLRTWLLFSWCCRTLGAAPIFGYNEQGFTEQHPANQAISGREEQIWTPGQLSIRAS